MSENTYAAAGVNIEEGDRAVELITPHAKRATRPEVMGGLGGFAGLFKLGDYKEPVLAAGSDGVGTKLAVAQAMDKHDTIGIDLVAMCVDDLVVCGAEPLFLQDYIAIGKVVPEKVADIVSGIAEGCVQAGCALLGGETAEHPGVMDVNDYDVSATAIGVGLPLLVLLPLGFASQMSLPLAARQNDLNLVVENALSVDLKLRDLNSRDVDLGIAAILAVAGLAGAGAIISQCVK